ncbi:hypothetical protein [Tenacibaculum agarivorans]|uniref:hypothetical protein n=1 Tax=Tenacibaculum agarivorans TaxID=1908389 RepID=UPI00094B9811|nr:hypothetical protein [Tenacibaculum agarivorans]
MSSQEFLQLDFGFNDEPTPKKATIIEQPSKKDSEEFVFTFMDCLTAPVIVYPSQWQSAIPKHVLENITISRMFTLMSGEKMASLTETLAYMIPRTFEHPLPYGWTNIYTWLGFQYVKSFKRELVEMTKEVAPEQLSRDEERDLKHLRIWIYEKRVKALKERMKSIRKEEVKKTPVQKDKTDTMNLFNS